VDRRTHVGVVDAHHPGHVPAQDRERPHADVGGLLAVEDGAGDLHLDDLAARHRLARRHAAGGFDPDDLEVGAQGATDDGAAGEQPAATDRRDEHVEVVDLLEQLERRGPLAGDDVGMVEGRQDGRAGPPRQLARRSRPGPRGSGRR
jgi:hypothetical protein